MEWFYDLVFYISVAIGITAMIVTPIGLVIVFFDLLFSKSNDEPSIWILTDATTAQRLEEPKATPVRQSRCDCTKSEKG